MKSRSKKLSKFLFKTPSETTSTDYHHQPNIVKAGAAIMKKFRTSQEVVVLAEMQSGKTEVMRRMIYLVNNHNEELHRMNVTIDRFNVWVVLSASSIQLKEQLQTKLPEIKHNIYHLTDINSMLKNLAESDSILTQMSDSGLVIFDECHCDAEIGKIIDKFRQMLGRIARQNETSYYILSSSASPYEQLNVAYPKVIMRPGSDYYGLRQMFEAKIPIVFPSKKLADPTQCLELFTEIEICCFYYIFRLADRKDDSDQMITNIETEFRKRGVGIDSFIYDMSYRGNINEIIQTQPNKPVVIYLKDKLRMGEYLDTTYVYVVHDDPCNCYTHTTIQSLLGRCCGYNKKANKTIIYCDYEKALEHYEWIKNDYDLRSIPSHAKYVSKTYNGNKDICIY